MFTSYLLSLREGVEAALVVGLVLGVLRRTGRTDCRGVVWSAVAGGVVLSVLAAATLRALDWSLTGPLEPIFEGLTLLLAAGLLTWMIFWMGRQARGLAAGIEADVGQAMSASGHRGLFALIFVAVAREGLELAIFLTASAFHTAAVPTMGAALLGLGTAALLAWLLLAGSVRLNLRRFFQFTNTLLLAFAAGLVAKAVHEFNEIDWIPALIDPLWNSSSILSDRSAAGHGLKTLFGYRSEPSLTVVIAYVAYLLAVIAVWTFAAARPNLRSLATLPSIPTPTPLKGGDRNTSVPRSGTARTPAKSGPVIEVSPSAPDPLPPRARNLDPNQGFRASASTRPCRGPKRE